ncbi:MAG: hypothetical protein ABIK93_02110 [candidate division WOR-3 bacterium]
MKKVFLFLVPLLLFCSKAKVDYYPLFIGSIRVYEIDRTTITGNDTNHRIIKQVTKVTEKAIHDYWDEVWKVSTQEVGSPPATAYIRKTQSEIRLIPNLNDTAGTMNQLVLPLTVGKSWIVAKSSDDTLVAKVLGIERVKVPVGEFDSCYKVEIKAKTADFQRLMWLAPNIGIVRNEIKTVFSQDKTPKTILEKSVLIQYNTKSKD